MKLIDTSKDQIFGKSTLVSRLDTSFATVLFHRWSERKNGDISSSFCFVGKEGIIGALYFRTVVGTSKIWHSITLDR